MFKLTDTLTNKIEVDGDILSLDLFFDTALLFYDLIDDDEFSDEEKIELAFIMFLGDNDIDPEDYTLETKDKVIASIVDSFFVEKDSKGNKKKQASSSTSKKLYDLKQDAQYIYASFLQDYKIDLLDVQGELRYEKFIALLIGLTDTTKFKEVVSIRATEEPRGSSKAEKEERDRIRKLKQAYALEQDQQTRENDLDQLFTKLAGSGNDE